MSGLKLQQVFEILWKAIFLLETLAMPIKVSMLCAGGEHKDNGLEQLIIQGEAFPVLRALIMKGKSAGVQEGAVRLLARLSSTPEAREQVRQHQASSTHDCITGLWPCY